jgi:hypothetical protein
MMGEQPFSKIALVPTLDPPKARGEGSVVVAEATVPWLKILLWTQLRGQMMIARTLTLKRTTTLSVPRSQAMWTWENPQSKEDLSRYSISSIILTTLAGFG